MDRDKKIVWSLSEEDFRSVIEDNHPELSEEQVDFLISKAYSKFNIESWAEYVDGYIEAYKDSL